MSLLDKIKDAKSKLDGLLSRIEVSDSISVYIDTASVNIRRTVREGNTFRSLIAPIPHDDVPKLIEALNKLVE